MTRQILHHLAKFKKFADALVRRIETGVMKLPLERIVCVLVFPRAHQTSQAVEGLWIERKRLADFARCRASAISDDVRRHRRAQFSVPLVNILNRALPLVSTWQIEIDIRPLAALFG